MIDYLSIIKQHFSLEKKETPDFDCMKLSPMTMESVCFYAEGLGHVSFMRGKALGGLMKMDTLVINPFEKDLPLFSLDRIYVLKKETLLIEMYETRLNPVSLEEEFSEIIAKYQELENGTSAPKWYDDIRLPESVHKIGKGKVGESFDALSAEYLNQFLMLAKNAPTCDKKEKAEASKKYSEGLLNNGGASTDVFIKKKGRDFTERFFRECMFGV